MTPPDHAADAPPPDQLADEHDQLGWDRDLHGTFADYATDDNAVPTVPAPDPSDDVPRYRGAR